MNSLGLIFLLILLMPGYYLTIKKNEWWVDTSFFFYSTSINIFVYMCQTLENSDEQSRSHAFMKYTF